MMEYQGIQAENNRHRLLVLGGSGMLGHKLCQVSSESCDTFATFRQPPAAVFEKILPPAKWRPGVGAKKNDSIRAVLNELRPDVVVNCIGVVKQLAAGTDPVACITVNSLFPHQLAHLCHERGIRLISISTDCVFSGKEGGYAEEDTSDASDLYGRTKFLGEVTAAGCLTLRTSIIGRELSGAHGVVEWFLSQNGGKVKGYTEAVFSGFTTQVLSRILGKIVTDFPDLQGLYHVAAAPITKYDLLCLIRDVCKLDVEIEPDDEFVCDRSLDGSRFREATGIVAPSWREMIEEMYADPTPYDGIRAQLAGKD